MWILTKPSWNGKNAFNALLVVRNLLFGEIQPLQSIQAMEHLNTLLWSINKNAVRRKTKHYIQINFVKMVTLIWLSMFVNVTIDWWLSFSNLFQMLIHSTIIHSAVSKVRFKKFPTNKAPKIVMNPNFRPRSLSNWMLQAWWWQRYLWHHQHSQILLWHSRCPTRWNMYPWRLLTTETFPICSNK